MTHSQHFGARLRELAGVSATADPSTTMAALDGKLGRGRPTAAAPAASTTQPTATPTVRALAQQLGVPLNTVTGTGAGGRIRREDIIQAAADPTPQTAEVVASAPVDPQTHDELIAAARETDVYKNWRL